MSYTAGELATIAEGELVGDENHQVTGVNGLHEAESSDASFLANPRYREALATTDAGVVCIDFETATLPGKNYIKTRNPSVAFQKIAEAFLASTLTGFKEIHETAVVHPSAEIGKNVELGPYVVIDAKAKIGEGTRILSHTYVGHSVVIGEECLIYQNVTLRERSYVGNRVILQPGCVIGSCGYGYETTPHGEHKKFAQLGNVVLEDDVEIGANTTIDRARFKSTIVRKGAKIDNLVQLGHNVEIGEHNLIVSQAGIAGSTKTGRHVVLGGQVGVSGHLEICPGVIVAAKGGITKSITKPGKYNGVPLQPINEYNRQQVHLRRIADLKSRLDRLEKSLPLP